MLRHKCFKVLTSKPWLSYNTFVFRKLPLIAANSISAADPPLLKTACATGYRTE